MRHFCRAPAHIQRRTCKFFDAQEVKADTSPNNVHHRIDRAYFMKMNLFERHVMHTPLGLAKFCENSRCGFANPRRQFRIFQNFENGAERAVLLLVLRFHLDEGGRHAVLPNFFGRELPTGNPKAAKFRAQMLDRTAGINQGPEGHVAANARKTV